MKDDKMKIEQRLQNMKKFYIKAGELIDKLPDAIPEKTRSMLKDTILGDKDLKRLMEGIDSHRPPRIFLIGRTGVGKSSLINALCGAYVAGVSDTKSCTEGAQIYECKDGDRVLMEILDTRGIAESESLDDKVTAEEMLIEQINEFSPDVAIFMLNCTHRDDVNTDVEFLKKVSKEYAKVNKLQLPIVVVINKCDEMAPSRFKNPVEYPENKINKINEVVQYYKGIIVKNGLRFLYKGIIIKHNKTEPTYTKTSLFLCEKRRFLWPGLRKEGNLFKLAGPGGLAFFHLTKKEVSKWPMKK